VLCQVLLLELLLLLLLHAVNCVRFCFWHCLWLFVCVWNISGTNEWICDKFTRKTCLVPCSDEFECQGQRSGSPRTKNRVFSGYLWNRWTDFRQVLMEDEFGPSLGQVWRSKIKVTRDKNVIFGPFGGLHAFMFGKASLASSSVYFLWVAMFVKNWWIVCLAQGSSYVNYKCVHSLRNVVSWLETLCRVTCCFDCCCN